MTTTENTKKPIYYGWYVCAATLFIGFVAVGARNCFGVFVVPMSDEFGWNRFTISVAAALGVMVNGLSQPFFGQIFDQTGGRKLILISIVVLGSATAMLALTFHILFLAFMFGLVVSMAQSGSGPSNTAALIARWFKRRRATAISINSSAVSMGGMIMVPFSMFLLQATNWRVAWLVLGIIVLSSLPIAYLFIRERPEDRGLYPDGDPAPLDDPGNATRRGLSGPLEVDTWKQSFRTAPIWQMAGSYFVCGTTTFVMSVHFIPFAIEERGISGATAATIFGYMMFVNIFGALGAGILSDKLGGTKNWLAFAYAMRGIGYVVLLTVDSVFGLWIFATIAGFSWVATPVLTSSLTADVYGTKALGTISGITFMFHQFGGFGSVLLAGLLFDITGSYTLPFALVGALLLPAAISAFSIKERKYSSRYQTQIPTPAAGD
ncbi:MAG: MFS transporter [SAR202 cluster bacterium]|jgi:sugar phosphate permease|nr:MFS transporter [Dehalococcoidia bacterium]MQF89120.1 MFS transporter [SAR202 cluster bacterium]|tara:strand:- start:1543 stop:2847 length:1305 start_codon:yes stop_codon:yes gene_type:complete